MMKNYKLLGSCRSGPEQILARWSMWDDADLYIARDMREALALSPNFSGVHIVQETETEVDVT